MSKDLDKVIYQNCRNLITAVFYQAAKDYKKRKNKVAEDLKGDTCKYLGSLIDLDPNAVLERLESGEVKIADVEDL